MPFTGPYPTNFGAVTSAMVINHTTFSGGVTNTGTIGAGGISVRSGAFISGRNISDLGVISGAIKVDSSSTIAGTGGPAIFIAAPTFTGGISNAGTISHQVGVKVTGVTVFGKSNGGGITNSGTIVASGDGITVN